MSADPLLVLLDTSYNQASWHGVNLRGSLRRVSLEAAAWRPAPGAHNVWELMVHAAYWKYAAWRRLTGAEARLVSARGLRTSSSARPTPPTPPGAPTSACSTPCTAISARPSRPRPRARSDTRLPGSRVTRLRLITGVAAHDVYHAGQIQLLKKLYSLRRAGR